MASGSFSVGSRVGSWATPSEACRLRGGFPRLVDGNRRDGSKDRLEEAVGCEEFGVVRNGSSVVSAYRRLSGRTYEPDAGRFPKGFDDEGAEDDDDD